MKSGSKTMILVICALLLMALSGTVSAYAASSPQALEYTAWIPNDGEVELIYQFVMPDEVTYVTIGIAQKLNHAGAAILIDPYGKVVGEYYRPPGPGTGERKLFSGEPIPGVWRLEIRGITWKYSEEAGLMEVYFRDFKGPRPVTKLVKELSGVVKAHSEGWFGFEVPEGTYSISWESNVAPQELGYYLFTDSRKTQLTNDLPLAPFTLDQEPVALFYPKPGMYELLVFNPTEKEIEFFIPIIQLLYKEEEILPTPAPTAVLQVRVLDPSNQPITDLEVGLWTASAPVGLPDAGGAYTNKQGIATFSIAPGNYEIGFNPLNFPDKFIYPDRIPVTVAEEGITEKTILLRLKLTPTPALTPIPTPTLTPTPILLLSNLKITPTTVTIGERVSITCIIANISNVKWCKGFIELKIDGQLVSKMDVSLAPEEKKQVKFPDYIPQRLEEHRVEVDGRILLVNHLPIAELKEYKPEINRLAGVFRVIPITPMPTPRPKNLPDLVISDVPHYPADPKEGDEVKFFVKINNKGEATASPVEVILKYEGPTTGSAKGYVRSIESGMTKETSLSKTFEQAGSYFFRVIVDPENEIKESKEDNNMFEFYLKIGPKGPNWILIIGIIALILILGGAGGGVSISRRRSRERLAEYKGKISQWEAEGYDVEEFKRRWFK